MKDFTVLKFLDRFRFVFHKLGIDYRIMRKILQMKLILDDRRVPTIIMGNKNEDEKSSYWKGLFLYGIMGVFIAILMFFRFPLFYKMNMVLGMVIFLIMTTMISDFSTVLLDIKDKNILLPRPVNPQTINAAKLLHILIYLFTITLTIAGPSLLVGTFVHGLGFFFIFIFTLVLICCFVMFLTSILYSVILGIFDGEKLKDIINYFQILLSIFMVVSYQFIGRIFEIVNLRITYTPKWWNYLLPSAWFAAPFELFIGKNPAPNVIGLGITGIVIPVAAFLIYLKAVIPHFERNLQKLNNSGSGKRVISKRKERWQLSRAKWMCGNKLEGSFYRFTRKILTNERKLKLRLFPNLALAVILPMVFLLNFSRHGASPAEILAEISGSKSYLFIYISVALFASLLQFMSSSEYYKGAWIYRALPVNSPVPVLKGALKGYILKYIVPAYILISLLFTAIYGIRIIPDIILMFVNMLLLTLFVFKCSKKELPFYKDFQYTQEGSNIGVVILTFIACGVFGGIHYFAGRYDFGVTLNLAVSLLLAVILWRISFKITWKDILKGDM